jgi:ribonuclease Y
MLPTLLIVLSILGTGLGLVLVLRRAARHSIARARERARAIVQDAESKAQIRLKEAELEAEERRAAAESQFEEKTRHRRQELQQQEERLKEQERNLQRRLQLLGQKQRETESLETRLKENERTLAERDRESQALLQERRQRLERIAGLSALQARRELVREIESEARLEAAGLLRRLEEEAREEAAGRARRLVAEAIERLPTGDIVDNVVTVVKLPNDEMKGRIIGREGRNIRAIEMATGVDLIVDETPQAIVLSAFDPLRRAVARAAIERLVEDGRIHPARIEEVVSRCRSEIEQGLEAAGEAAAFEIGLTGLPQRLTRLLGRLRYRVVNGYNLLDHSLAVARLAHQMATLLGAHAETARRAGLLHEVGQVEEGEASSAHPIEVGADLLARAGEEARVVQAVRSLHAGGPAPSVEAVLLRVAERAVIARPGERDDNLEVFIERLGALESIASSFSGVEKAYAMRAGKELRVIVEASAASDSDAIWLSKEITARIRKEVEYPGSVRISVIRETRAVDFAT